MANRDLKYTTVVIVSINTIKTTFQSKFWFLTSLNNKFTRQQKEAGNWQLLFVPVFMYAGGNPKLQSKVVFIVLIYTTTEHKKTKKRRKINHNENADLKK